MGLDAANKPQRSTLQLRSSSPGLPCLAESVFPPITRKYSVNRELHELDGNNIARGADKAIQSTTEIERASDVGPHPTGIADYSMVALPIGGSRSKRGHVTAGKIAKQHEEAATCIAGGKSRERDGIGSACGCAGERAENRHRPAAGGLRTKNHESRARRRKAAPLGNYSLYRVHLP